jgi:hypothetical protein
MGGYAKVNFCHAGWSVQWDVAGDVVRADDTSDFSRLMAGQFGTVAHLYMRDPSRHAFGVLFGVGKLLEDYSQDNPGHLAQIGVDGHLYLGSTTLAGQAVYMKTFGGDPAGYAVIDHGLTLLGEVRHFVHPNFKVSALAGWHWDEPIAVSSPNALAISDTFFGATAEAKLGDTPFAMFGSVVRHVVAAGVNGSDHPNTTTFKLGVAAHFNQPTLFAEDRNGASFNTPMVDSWQHLDNAYYR